MKYISIFFYLVLFCGFPLIAKEATPHKTDLWKQGTGKHNNYRIPSIILTTTGTLLAFCEGREGGDSGDIDLLVKRSKDNGETWSQAKVVWDDKQNTCGNPCPVVNEETGRIWLFATWNNGHDHESKIIQKTSDKPRLPYLLYSDDDGVTWSTPVDMSESCRDTSWGWYATGPGIGIQLLNGNHKGRLVIPSNHSYDDPQGAIADGPFGYGAHVLYSDDHGETWNMSQSIIPGCNESQVTELTDGSLLMNMRSYNKQFSRAISKSNDGGETWAPITHDRQLVESKCQASILKYGKYQQQQMHLFLNPSVPAGRSHLTLKASFDNCNSWSNAKLIFAGQAAYSCMTLLPDDRVGLFFENGIKRPYEKMTFISFKVDEIFNPGTLILD